MPRGRPAASAHRAPLRSRESAFDVVDVLDDAVRVRLELDELERALLAGDLDLARLHAGRYAALTREPAVA